MLSFQSAPLTEARGDAGQGAARAGTAKFQSAPLTEARGDFYLVPEQWVDLGFNPLPSPKQGETAHFDQIRPLGVVSIRSPHRSKGRRLLEAFDADLARFQSAPLTEARGDRKTVVLKIWQSGFNPLPSPKQGETALLLSNDSDLSVSIRSPHRSKGRLKPLSVCVKKEGFQSAPLTEARGDSTEATSTASSALTFQSAPLTEARGDALAKWGMPGLATFQSAPLTEARGDSRLGASSDRPAGFNPLPSPKQGETDDLAAASLR